MASLKRCIIEKCKECIYDPSARGTWRGQVKNCTSMKCPLYDVRPGNTTPKLSKKKTVLSDTNDRSIEETIDVEKVQQ